MSTVEVDADTLARLVEATERLADAVQLLALRESPVQHPVWEPTLFTWPS